jgi:hypothetical protein
VRTIKALIRITNLNQHLTGQPVVRFLGGTDSSQSDAFPFFSLFLLTVLQGDGFARTKTANLSLVLSDRGDVAQSR